MTVAPPAVVPILATPFGVMPLPVAAALNPALAELFAARIRTDRVRRSNPLVYQSRDDLLEWPEQPVRQLTAEIFRGVYSVVDTVNNFDDAQVRSLRLEARGWFTVIGQDGCVPATNYPLTAWCAIYCIAAPAPSATRQDSGLLRLYQSGLGTMFQDATNAVMRIPYTTGHYAWRPVPGELAVFPASLTHEIALLRSPGELVLVTARVRFVAPGQLGVRRW